MSDRARIGWIGLGNMGSRMAPNLIRAGYRVSVYDVDASRVAALEAMGARPADSMATLAAGSDLVISMIPDDAVLLEIATGAGGVAEQLAANGCFIDMSTVSPAASAEVAAALTKRGISYLRAPVSGSTALAAAATLTIFVSGDAEALRKHRPVLEVLGRKVTYLGAAEEARVTKLMINLMVGAINGALGEALNFGRRNGLDWTTMIDTIADSVAASPYVASKIDKLRQRDWNAAAPISLIAKDMALALKLGQQSGTFMPQAAVVHQTLCAMEGTGRGHLDMSAIVELFEG